MTMPELPEPPTGEPGTVRQQPGTMKTAVRTALPFEGREWFILDLVNGGFYSNGIECVDWPVVSTPPPAEVD